MSAACDWLRSRVAAGADLRLDSREIMSGDVFVACPGTRADGRHHVAAALAAGAAAVLYEASGATADLDDALRASGLPCLAVQDLRAQLGALGDAWYGQPSRQLTVIAVTGTNGKTSCAHWIAQALNDAGAACGVIGTLGVRFPGGATAETGLTTPDVLGLHRTLAAMVRAGATAVAMEASSIGLDQGRMDGVRIAVAGFTNLTRDHLDAHGDMASYEAAKARLFAWPGLDTAVINLADAAGVRLASTTSAPRVFGYHRGIDVANEAALVAVDAQATPDGTLFTLRAADGAEALIRTSLPGMHNVDNLLLVSGVLRALGWPLQRVAGALARLSPVAGRLQPVATAGSVGPLVVVDYAHTPDALRNVLQALRPVADTRGGRLVCVFGCGGDRDAGKRGPMGAAASEGADAVVVTSDNPRSEAVEAIIAHILAGMPGNGAGAHVEPDRARAILDAIWRARPADVVLLAGKGHETAQEIAGRRWPFADAEWARLALALPLAAGVTTDTRSVQPGELFVALTGERFDGHDFLTVAATAGARAAVVARPVDAALPVIMLGDTRAALLRMAAAWRARHEIPLVAVAGSNGKTTTKEMVAAIFAAWLGAPHTLATRGNLNNDIGVPLTLLRLRSTHRAAVIELGMNHPGEIAVLAHAAAPTVALVNNAQREHQEFMHTVEAVARENGEVIAALGADGIAVYPGDEAYTPLWDAMAGQRQRLRFGFGDGVDVTARDVTASDDATRFTLCTPQGNVAVRLPVAGRHNLRNALAAAACALAAGCPTDAVARGLDGFVAVTGRMQGRRLSSGTWLIDDTYNANPDSVRAAIDVLAGLPAPRVLVLGDMGEVGAEGPAVHREIGAYARERGIERLLGTGEATRDAVAAFGAGGTHLDDVATMTQRILAEPASAILVKGSRFMRMERVVAALQASENVAGEAGHAA